MITTNNRATVSGAKHDPASKRQTHGETRLKTRVPVGCLVVTVMQTSARLALAGSSSRQLAVPRQHASAGEGSAAAALLVAPLALADAREDANTAAVPPH